MDTYASLRITARFWTILFLCGCDCFLKGDPDDNINSRLNIIGGVETGYKSWQGVLALEIQAENGMLECTGILIHPKMILTAAHCAWDEGLGIHLDDLEGNREIISVKNGSKVGLSNISLKDDDNAMYRAVENGDILTWAERIVYHPNWNGIVSETGADIALIYLKSELNDLPFYRLRGYPPPKRGNKGKVVGYGEDGEGVDGIHRQGDTIIKAVSEYTFETGSPANTCIGDSGAPLFTYQDNEWVVTGVASFGKEHSCNADGASYSINLLTYCDWLNETIYYLTQEKNAVEDCPLPVSYLESEYNDSEDCIFSPPKKKNRWILSILKLLLVGDESGDGKVGRRMGTGRMGTELNK